LRANPFIQTTPAQEQEMLASAGAADIDGLFREQVPAALLGNGGVELPPAMGEAELLAHIRQLASACTATGQVTSFLGGGCYDHFIPSAGEALANRAEFVTAYTPYQPEASQGTLQAFFEYQSLMARLYAMDASNASLYDGASALGEAVFLALAVHPDRRKVLLPFALHPDYRTVVRSYVQHLDVEVAEIAERDGRTDYAALAAAAGADTAAIVVSQPNFFGCLEDVGAVARIAKECGALFIAVADPFSLGILAPPGEYGADVAVGEGQPLGLRQYLGGETLGIFTCRHEFLRRMPGRLVGLTRDRNGRRGYVLTLQTREQHIRREKATSNICTNHAHNALRATIYLALAGPQGLRLLARRCARNLAFFRRELAEAAPGAIAFDAPVFRETVVKLRCPAADACAELATRGFYAGVPLGLLGERYENLLLVAVTERRTDQEITAFVQALRDFV